MRILMIGDRNDGGIKRHVDTISAELRKYAEVVEINGDSFCGRNGHDLRMLFQFIRTYRRVKPEVVHFHTSVFWFAVCIFAIRIKRRIFRQPPLAVLRSWHTPTVSKEMWRRRFFRVLLGKECYYLPVSKRTWDALTWATPVKLRGEVLYNPASPSANRKEAKEQKGSAIVGLIGRFAPQKDWQSYVAICNKITASIGRLVKDNGWDKVLYAAKMAKMVCWGVGVSKAEAAAIFGEDARAIDWKGYQPDGRAWIRKMDVFVLTSKHEEMPTVVLEAFAERTAICGFIPEGGMSEILEYSQGPLKDVFIEERDIGRLSEIVLSLVLDEKKRQGVIEDGWRIFNEYFSVGKIVKNGLMPIYERLLGSAEENGAL